MTEYNTDIYAGDHLVASLPRPSRRWLLWHVTGRCNIECDYCYGSFDGGSYKQDFRARDDVAMSDLLRVAEDLKPAGIDAVHINGGEPLLRRGLHDLVSSLERSGVEVWLLTNATFRTPEIDRLVTDGLVSRLAISLDTAQPVIGDLQRRKSQTAIENARHYSQLIQDANSRTRLAVYVVLTKLNMDHLDSLAELLTELRADYVNMQPVFLPADHRDGERLGLGHLKLDAILERYDYLRSRLPRSSMSGAALEAVIRASYERGEARATNCFAELADYFYLDPRGNLYGCPAKPSHARKSLGNVLTTNVKELIERAVAASHEKQCPFLSTDCLGMYEMAHPGEERK